MTISLHLHDVHDHDRIRARLAAETEEWLRQRKLQQPEQVPGAERYIDPKPMPPSPTRRSNHDEH